MIFEITHEPIILDLTHLKLDYPAMGARVSFEGIVRNHNFKKAVESLEYTGYESMAVKEGEKILSAALDKFGLIGAYGIHRLGLLAVGEIAVQIITCSGHRQEAFDAGIWIMDEIKKEVPIWKKEFYIDGVATWPECPRCANLK